MANTVVSSFLIGQFPVTAGEWKSCVADGGCDQMVEGLDDEPANNLCLTDIQQYLRWLSRTTGMEYAARVSVLPALPVASPPLVVPPGMMPERRQAVSQAPPPKTEPSKPDAGKSEPVRVDAMKPEPQKLVSPKSTTPAPPPLKLVPPRQDTDDAQSDLAQLQQLVPSPPPRLVAARSALANGRIEDARWLLQAAQLQLVFRPVDASGAESPWADKGARDVAHALKALNAGDVSLSRRYVDVALDDLSGNPVSQPVQASGSSELGHAPAYPPR